VRATTSGGAMGKSRKRRAVRVALPLAATIVAVVGGAEAAGAARQTRSDPFTFTSDATGEPVTCTIDGSFESTERPSGDWDLTAVVRISSASSPECFDGIASLTVAQEPEEHYAGGGSFVQADTTTATEVTSISYELYFNPCACYSERYTAPK
jgi:hypothetical protein